MLIVDAHLDLSMNALEWNRDYTQPIEEIRAREAHLTDKPDRGLGVISFDEMRKGNIGLCVATQIARYVKKGSELPGWHSPEQAWAQSQGQLAWYKMMEKRGEMTQITDLNSLHTHLKSWHNGLEDKHPIGYILSLEGADSIVDLSHLEIAHAYGLRALGPAHYGPGSYAFGTDSEGPLPRKGIELLKKLEELNIILDATHLSDICFWTALENYSGPVWASHHLTRALTPHNRQLSDDMIKALIERGAVIGMAFDAWMIVPAWVRGKTDPVTAGANMEKIIDHLDHICQIAGNANHVGIGSDLDGGFGREQSPYDLETIADLQKVTDILQKRGYSAKDIEGIMHRNWISFLERAWS